MTQPQRRAALKSLAGAALAPLLLPAARAHEGHLAAAGAPRLSAASVQLPALQLTRQDGRTLPLALLLGEDRPVVMNFIFTSCTAICPVLSQVFAEVRDRLGEQRGRYHFVSASIDPEQDTPRRLREYGARFNADEGWTFLTGSTAACAALQTAFGINRGDKMNHVPATFIRAARAGAWTRVDGFASPALLLAQLRGLPPAA